MARTRALVGGCGYGGSDRRDRLRLRRQAGRLERDRHGHGAARAPRSTHRRGELADLPREPRPHRRRHDLARRLRVPPNLDPAVRRAGLRGAARASATASTSQPRTTPSTRSTRRTARSPGSATSALRSRDRRCPAATSSRSPGSPARPRSPAARSTSTAFLSGYRHVLFGLRLRGGKVTLKRNVDAPGSDPRVHQERSALSVSKGRVYVPFGGLTGDCGDYRGPGRLGEDAWQAAEADLHRRGSP